MDDLNSTLYELARHIGPQLPYLITVAICLVIALVRWRRHPKVSLLTALALGLMLLHSFVFALVYVLMARSLLESTGLEANKFYWILGMVVNLTLAVAFAVLLVAIFVDRKPAPTIDINVQGLRPR